MSEPTRYHGGTSVIGGRTRLLAAETFKDLVQSQIHVPVAFPMKRRDFLAHPDRDKLKDGAWVAPATYPEDECARSNQDADGFSLVIIDLDGGQEAADFAESPDTIREALAPLNFAAWTTAKHTPEEPRLKIMVDATGDKDLFKRTVLHVIGLLGLSENFKGKPESMVISQPQYRPMHFQGEEYSAVIASRLDGERLDAATLPDIDDSPMPDESGYAYIPEPGEMDISSILNCPLRDVSLDDARSALAAIDADCGYRPWYEIAAALRHQFTGEEDAYEAFEMFHEWSATGTTYRDREECLLKWRSFKPYPEGRNPITARTLFHKAIQAGWKHETMTGRQTEDFATWAAETEPSIVQVEGVRRIAALAIPSDIQEELMAEHIVRAVKRGGNSITKTAILKDVKRQRRQEKIDATKAEKPSWMLPFCFIGPRDKFRNTITGREYSVDAFNHTFGRHLIGIDGELGVPAANYALYIAEIKIVDDSMYDPRQSKGDEVKAHGEDVYFEKDGQSWVNTYLKSSVPDASPVGAERAGNLVRALLAANFSDPDHCRRLLDWVAYSIQFPGHKTRWSPFTQGGQGSGKGTFIATIECSVGKRNFKVVTGSDLTGSNFNEWREGSHFAYVDEMFSAGANRHEVNNRMKDAITNDHVSVTQKNKDLRNIDNVTNYFFTTNKHDGMVLEDSDRRYFYLKSRLQDKRSVQAFLATGVCERIHELVKSNPGAFRQFYLSHEISDDFDPNGHAPDTVFRHELVDAGKNPMLVQIEDLIADPAYPLIGKDVIHYGVVERETALLGRNNARPSHYLHILGYQAYEKGEIFEVNGERARIYVSVDGFTEGLEDPAELLEERTPEL